MTLSPSLELLIRDDIATYDVFIAIEGTEEFDILSRICLANGAEDPSTIWCKTFNLTEVKMPGGGYADAIVVTSLPAEVCA